jgi:hypothetical protein
MLEKLNKFLVDKNYQSTFEKADTNGFYDRLEIKFASVINGQNVYWPIELSDLPVKEEGFEGFSLLQFYIPIVGELEAVNYLPICDLIVKLNTKLTIGSFGFLHTHNLVFFKHNLIISNENFEENCGIIDKTLSILFFILINFQKPLSNVAQGNSSVDNAMEEMPLGYIYK